MGVGRRGIALAAATVLAFAGGAVPAGPACAVGMPGAAGLKALPPVEDGTPPPAAACRWRDTKDVQSQRLTKAQQAQRTWPEARLDYLQAQRYGRGAGIVVAVVDTGVDGNHEQLRNAVRPGEDVTRGTPVPGADTDCGAHGTEVAGIIAARPVDGVGFVGIAPEAVIWPVRHMWGVDAHGRETSGSAASLLRGIRAAVTSGARIVNVSVAVPALSLTAAEKAEFARMAHTAQSRDVLIVAAAGNRTSYQGKNLQTYPAALSTTSPVVMAVSGINPDGTPDADAISGAFVSVAAPGQKMPCLLDHGGLVPCGGTSFAAPFVSGLAALVRQRFPQLSAPQVRARIEATADRPSTALPDPHLGFGVINPVAALTAVLPAASAPPAPVAAPPLPRPPSDAALRRTTTLVAAGAVALVALVLVGWATVRRGRRRGWRPGRLPGAAGAGGEGVVSPREPAAGAPSG